MRLKENFWYRSVSEGTADSSTSWLASQWTPGQITGREGGRQSRAQSSATSSFSIEVLVLHLERHHFSQAMSLLALCLGVLKHQGMCLPSLGNRTDANLQNISELH